MARDPEDWGAVLWHSLGLAWATLESTDGLRGLLMGCSHDDSIRGRGSSPRPPFRGQG